MENKDVRPSVGTPWPVDIDEDDLLVFDKEQKPFHLPNDEDEKALPLKCNKCGGKEFNVAQGYYYTAIRCIRCKWECGIHSG